MSTSHDGTGATGPGAATRGIVISIFSRRRFDTIGDAMRSGTRDLSQAVAELTGRIRYLAYRWPLLATGIALALGFSIGLLLSRRARR